MFRRIAGLLAPDGVFVSWDYTGPHRNQYDATQWDALHRLNDELPPPLRKRLNYPHLPTMLATDPSEAVHSELVLPTIARYFDVAHLRHLGGGLPYELLTFNDAMFDVAIDSATESAKILAADVIYTDLHPFERSMFSYVIATPRRTPPSADDLVHWTTEEQAREAAAVAAGGRYGPDTLIGSLTSRIEQLERSVAASDASAPVERAAGRGELAGRRADAVARRIRGAATVPPRPPQLSFGPGAGLGAETQRTGSPSPSRQAEPDRLWPWTGGQPGTAPVRALPRRRRPRPFRLAPRRWSAGRRGCGPSPARSGSRSRPDPPTTRARPPRHPPAHRHPVAGERAQAGPGALHRRSSSVVVALTRSMASATSSSGTGVARFARRLVGRGAEHVRALRLPVVALVDMVHQRTVRIEFDLRRADRDRPAHRPQAERPRAGERHLVAPCTCGEHDGAGAIALPLGTTPPNRAAEAIDRGDRPDGSTTSPPARGPRERTLMEAITSISAA